MLSAFLPRPFTIHPWQQPRPKLCVHNVMEMTSLALWFRILMQVLNICQGNTAKAQRLLLSSSYQLAMPCCFGLGAVASIMKLPLPCCFLISAATDLMNSQVLHPQRTIMNHFSAVCLTVFFFFSTVIFSYRNICVIVIFMPRLCQ